MLAEVYIVKLAHVCQRKERREGRTNPKSLIFRADENGRNDISNNETRQKDIVHPGMPQSVENAQTDQANGTHDGRQN